MDKVMKIIEKNRKETYICLITSIIMYGILTIIGVVYSITYNEQSLLIIIILFFVSTWSIHLSQLNTLWEIRRSIHNWRRK